jgi:diguanylate cyclase (GGDEF)-like protein
MLAVPYPARPPKNIGSREGLDLTMGLRARLLLIVVVGLGLSLLASMILLLRWERQDHIAVSAERAGAMLQTLSVPVALFLTQGRLADLDNLMNELGRAREDLELDELVLVDHDGRALAYTGDAAAPDHFGAELAGDAFIAQAIASRRPLVQRKDRLPHRVAVPVQTGIRWATLIGTLSETALEAHIAERQRRLVISAVTISVLGLLLLLGFLQRAVVSPIRAVGGAAHRFADGDLSARAPVRGGDEIATVATALNTAAERLSHYTEELETAVKRRTDELVKTNDELVRANERLEQLATTDGLTELINHRRFHELLEREFVRQRREHRPFAVVMIDVDNFKHYNDSHGHPAGDGVLKRISRILADNVRASDVVARYGGEEFILLLIDTDLETATQVAEKLRELVAGHPFPYAEQQPLGNVSISLGVAAWPDHGTTPKELIQAADKALYAAKAFGRDVVVPAHEGIVDEVIE